MATRVGQANRGDQARSGFEPVGPGEPLVLKRLEGGAGAMAGGDVAFGRIGGEPADQVVTELREEGVVGAVGQGSAAAVEGWSGRWVAGRHSAAFGVSTETMRTGRTPHTSQPGSRSWSLDAAYRLGR